MFLLRTNLPLLCLLLCCAFYRLVVREQYFSYIQKTVSK